MAQQLASLSIDEVQLGASRASDPFIFVVGHILIILQKCWTFIDVAGQVKTKWAIAKYDGPETLGSMKPG